MAASSEMTIVLIAIMRTRQPECHSFRNPFRRLIEYNFLGSRKTARDIVQKPNNDGYTNSTRLVSGPTAINKAELLISRKRLQGLR